MTCGMQNRDFLDLGRRNVLPAPDDQLLDAARDREIAVRVGFREIAGVIPALSQRRRGFRRLVVIAMHQVGTANDQLTFGTDRHILERCRIDDPRRETRHRKAARSHRTTTAGPVHRHHRRGFGNAVTVQQRRAKTLLKGPVQRRGHDRARGNAQSRAAKSGYIRSGYAGFLRTLQQIVKHRRHARKYRILSGLQQLQGLLRREALQDVLTGADGQHAEHRQIETVGMEQWKRRQHDVLCR